MRILYTETTEYLPSSAHFLEALSARAATGSIELGFLDEARYLPANATIAGRIARRIVGRPLRGYGEINRALLEMAERLRPEIALIAKGAFFTPATLRALKAAGATLVNYAADDPFNPASGSRDLTESIPLFDLYLCARRAMIADVERAGCPHTAYIMFGYKPEVHFPEPLANAEERARFESDVVFIGGCDPDRAPYFERLVRELPQLRIHLHGGYFDRYPALKPRWRGLVSGADYRKAISGAKIVLNLVRRANRDDHVMRTFEVPACGGFMLAERTATHEQLFEENREAVFFDTADDMVARIREWLGRDEQRRQIAAAGHDKVVQGHHSYADRLDQILAQALRLRADKHHLEAGASPDQPS
ncbi:MAG TPA: glycosyltransferase [Candidatus Binataceae bacterium]|nr:glycosyltransferase [Candidatus Binataceae bacterium]